MSGSISSATGGIPTIKPASTPPSMSRDEVKMLESLAKHQPDEAKKYFASYPDKIAPFAAAKPEVAAKLGLTAAAAPKPAEEASSSPVTQPETAPASSLSKDELKMLTTFATTQPDQAKKYFAANPEKAVAFATANPEVATKLGIALPAPKETPSKPAQDAAVISPAAQNAQTPKCVDPKFAEAADGLSGQDFYDLVKQYNAEHTDPVAASAAPAAPAAPASKPAEQVKAPAEAPAKADRGQVTVVKGDTLSKLAASHGVSLAELKAANPDLFKEGVDGHGHMRKANGDLIYPGDVVKIPIRGSVPTAEAGKPAAQDSVKAGGATAPAVGVEAQQRKQAELYRARIEQMASDRLGHEVKIHVDSNASPIEQVNLIGHVLGELGKAGAKDISEINLKVGDAAKGDGYEVSRKEKTLEIVHHPAGAASAARTSALPAEQQKIVDHFKTTAEAFIASSDRVDSAKEKLAKVTEGGTQEEKKAAVAELKQATLDLQVKMEALPEAFKGMRSLPPEVEHDYLALETRVGQILDKL